MASIFYELSQLQGFKSLLQEAKDFFKHVCEQQDSKSKKIYIDFKQTNLFYCQSTFDSPSISDILNFFDDISIEIDYSSKVYDSIYQIISKLKRTSVPKMKIIIIITSRRDIGKSFIDKNQRSFIQRMFLIVQGHSTAKTCIT